MSVRRTALLVLVAASCVDCVDTKGRFDDYNERFEDYKKRLADAEKDAAVPDASDCEPASIQALEGRYLFAFAPSLDKTKAIVMSLVLTTTKSKTEMDGVFKALSVGDLEPVGEDIEVKVELDGAGFKFEKVNLVVPGAANALTPGLDANAEVTLFGTVCAPSDGKAATFLCGDGEGAIVDPIEIPLDGSEFGAVRVEKGDPWPEPVSTCAMGNDRS
jgi:hypothetical protein